MKFKDQFVILCDSFDEFNQCAKFLIKNGYKVLHYGEPRWIETKTEWNGLRFNEECDYWNRTRIYSDRIKEIKFKYFIRKYKMRKLYADNI